MKKNLIIFLFSLSLFASESSFFVLGDKNYSPYAGAENLLTIHNFSEEIQNYWKIDKPPSKAWSARFLRLGEVVLIWNPLNYSTMVVQHELFGHAYRIRDLGPDYAMVSKFHIAPPPPYGKGGGYTAYLIYDDLSPTMQTAISIGGVESTAILASRIKMHWLKDGEIDPKKSSLYFYSQHDLTFYIADLENENSLTGDSGHDIEDYLYWLHEAFPSGNLTKNTLKALTALNFLDPFTFYALYAELHYIFTGAVTSIPMIPLFGARYLPTFRLGLAPFGPEYFFENYLVVNDNPLCAYCKWGTFAQNSYWGAGIEYPYLYSSENNSIGFCADIWNQPRKSKSNNRPGISFSLIGKYQQDAIPVTIFLQLGYKTKGYVLGESLFSGPIVRTGIQGTF